MYRSTPAQHARPEARPTVVPCPERTHFPPSATKARAALATDAAARFVLHCREANEAAAEIRALAARSSR